MRLSFKGVASATVVAVGLGTAASWAFDDGLSHCEHDGDGGAIVVTDDGERIPSSGWTINFETDQCVTNTSGEPLTLPLISTPLTTAFTQQNTSDAHNLICAVGENGLSVVEAETGEPVEEAEIVGSDADSCYFTLRTSPGTYNGAISRGPGF